MSGESGGIIMGGIVLVGAMGVVLAGAAAYGAIRLGVAATKAGIRAYGRHKERQQLEVKMASRELNELYTRMQQAVEQQAVLSDQYRQGLEKEVHQSAEHLETLVRQDNQAVENWRRQLDDTQKTLLDQVRQNGKQQRDQIARQTRQEMSQLIAETESARAALRDSIDWSSRKAEQLAMHKSFAASLLQDARASLRLLESLDVGMANGYAGKVDVLRTSLSAAERHFNNELWDLCAADCQDLIFRSARIALEQSQTQLEADEMRADVTARLEGLAAQLDACRQVQFFDEYLNEDVTEDLNDFTQGEYERQQQAVRDLLARTASDTMTVEMLQAIHEEIDSTLEGNVSTVIEVAHQRLLAYYQKTRTMEELTNHMMSQNYDMDWACNPSDDPTQPLSVRFTNRASGNSVVVTLHDDMTASDMNRMMMDLDVFFSNGRTVTESEKQDIRDHMTQALSAAGLAGNLACQGRVNQESSRTERREEETIRATAPTPLFRNAEAD